MLTTLKIRKYYKDIQEKIFHMIPEKWDKLYLYASVIENFNNLETGEMFFYYFPKGILKKAPVNVYEISNKFNIDEEKYLKLVEELYDIIKKLRKQFIKDNNKKWNSVNILIENLKFIVEYNYEDIENNEYSSYEKHVIWRYKYLSNNLYSYNKKDREIINMYISKNSDSQKNIETYIENLYANPVYNIIEYDKQEKEIIDNEIIEEKNIDYTNQILNFNNIK